LTISGRPVDVWERTCFGHGNNACKQVFSILALVNQEFLSYQDLGS
jgi:hypothetical protein